MNTYDSQVAAGILERAGYEVIAREEEAENGPGGKEPSAEAAKADVVLLNTCAVREHAEARVFGRLGIYGKAKKQRPGLLVGLMGCMVEEHREALFKRFPQLDFMIGTRNIKELPQVIAESLERRRQVLRIREDGLAIEYSDFIKRERGFHAWLPIMTGCNKVCTFCIVPKTRGAEVSMPPEEVLREARRLVADGVKWITLLGQNVNSYQGSGIRDQESVDFSGLLERLCAVSGLDRISFTTSHPADATEALFKTIAAHPKISRRFHLPLQSGSDRILKRMKRLHTYREFKEKIDRLRALVPGIGLTTDIIAGFPGETGEDHQATVQALEEIRFDGAFIYKYSERPGTPASKLADDVPIHIKEQRNRELLEIQKRITEERNRAYLSRILEVFVEGTSRKKTAGLLGRSLEEKKVVFPGPAALVGTFQKVTLEKLVHDTFVGERVDP
ncbi:MAG: tRNA (N6-isopentenyl adenosine(37)-C2)-methylthiotransferase MiaB [Candidatus Omnitrophota bacterium]